EGQRRGIECGPINTIPEAFDDPQLKSRGYWIDVEHREMGRSFKYPGAPYRLTETPWSVRRRAPLIGEDNAAIFGGELGLSSEELSSLAESGVIYPE
ncbi:MAG: CoA transferase, partial [bacterium]